MRIAFIHPFLSRYPRGIERYILNLANTLARREIEVHLLTWRWPQPIQIETLESQVRVHRMPTLRYYAASLVVPFYVWNLLTQAYDFVWIFFAGYGEAEALTLARQQRFGIVFHYPYDQVPHRYHEFLRYKLAKRAAQIVSVSQFVADGVQEFFGRTSQVIHHGVDSERFQPDSSARVRMRHELNLPLNVPVLITAAALEERKGVQWVLRALPQVLHDHPETVYLVLGDGPNRADLEKLTRELGLESCVRFMGAQQDVVSYYQVADLSLILSRGEASSLTTLESLACGVPAIVARQPPFDELIASDYGMMVNEEDRDAVASAIVELLSDAVRRRVMGEAGRARVLTDFTWERVAEQYLQILSSGAHVW
ncbi:MAG: glycosyltransferase family 4 protein [Anaerolineales bacterium]|nr:glycosyltransferase family 4 protein [Chloroflexota bacterium]MBL6980708.1 glycosyltransferase family 4 protein [Anaerolineales bacterium]